MRIENKPVITKIINGENVSQYGAFPSSCILTFRVEIPFSFGTTAPILRAASDGGSDRDTLFVFTGRSRTGDIYEAVLNPHDYIENDGLVFYEIVFPNGYGAFFTDASNNLDFGLSDFPGRRFSLLFFLDGFETPEWFKGKTMYHIFVDRFFRGEGKTSLHHGAVINSDWNNGIPQYGDYAGAYVENNEFFGGNLWGVIEKLPYLRSLGIGVIYLSPVFEAKSNHKYDTYDYLTTDSEFGGDEAFCKLKNEADRLGIRIILDGVFNHTGDESIYFDRYDTTKKGAYNHLNSEYRDWYTFKDDGSYDCWWGIPIMPRLNQNNEKCRSFFTSENGIAGRYTNKIFGGWRLDVADELPDEFLEEFRKTVKKKSDGQAVVIGEVWENASVKISYGKRRRYFRGLQLDSVMNYPFRNAVISFCRDGYADEFYDTVTEIYASYPRQVSDCLMNIIGTHDTERILTVLGGDDGTGLTNAELSVLRMSGEKRKMAIERLKIASVLQYTVYGVPCLYYGDEAGSEGYHDPFCRMPFPWGAEDAELTRHYTLLGKLRAEHGVFANGDFSFSEHGNGYVVFERMNEKEKIVVAANCGKESVTVGLDGKYKELLTGSEYDGAYILGRMTVAVLCKEV